MRYHYSLVPGDEPIIRDLPVYSSTSIANGALLMLGKTDPDSNADQSISFIPAYATSSSATCVDTVGILQDSTYASVSPGNVYASNANGAKYGKVIINPLAVYLAEWLSDTGNDLAAVTSSGTSLNFTTSEDDIDGGWVFFTKNATASNKNTLRFITASAANSLTMDSALPAAATSSDTVIIVRPQNHRTLDLDAGSVGIATGTVTGASTRIHIAENYIQSDAISFQPLRVVSHKGKNSVAGGRFFSDLIQLDHVYNNLS